MFGKAENERLEVESVMKNSFVNFQKIGKVVGASPMNPGYIPIITEMSPFTTVSGEMVTSFAVPTNITVPPSR